MPPMAGRHAPMMTTAMTDRVQARAAVPGRVGWGLVTSLETDDMVLANRRGANARPESL